MMVEPYVFRDWFIRPDMMEPIRAYIEDHHPTGGFLAAVISNDLNGAVSRADPSNLINLPAFTAYFYNEAPPECWGSPERMKAWLERGPSS